MRRIAPFARRSLSPAESRVHRFLLRAPLFVAAAIILFGAGCRTAGPSRAFLEQARKHPDQVVWVSRVAPLAGDNLSAEQKLIGGVIRHRTRGSEQRLRRELAADTQTVGPVEAADRAARARGLWTVRSVGDTDRLRQLLQVGAPVVVALTRSVFFGAQPEPWLVVGYDDADGLYFCLDAGGRSELLPQQSFEAAWRRADRRWILVLPPEVDDRLLAPDERFARGIFHESRADWERALADYQAAAGADAPRRAAALVRTGNVWLRMNRPEEAEAAYRAAIRAAPESAQAYNNLAMLLAETGGRADEAVRLARNALALDPANPRVLDTLGYALYKNGQPREAADVLERARGRARWLPAPVQAEIAVHLVRAHVANGYTHLAREVLRDAVRLAPEVVPQDLRELLK